MKHLFCIFVISSLAVCSLRAQDAVKVTEQLISDLYEEYSSESETDIDYETFFTDLMETAQHPINLNTATKEQLEKLPFLSDIQVENILAYLYRNGYMDNIYELQLVDGLDMTDIRRMLPFVFVGEKQIKAEPIIWREVWKYGRQEMLLRLDHGLETKEGYIRNPEDDDSGADTLSTAYSGDPFYTSLKYRFNYKDRIMAGMAAEKDAGESFWSSKSKGYDFYSGYVLVNDAGKFKRIVAGDFRAEFGLGLVLRSGFGMGKSAYVLNVTPHSGGLKKYSSTDENNFFRGAGATLHWGKTDITLFYSRKKIDADTTNGCFTSLYTTGLHRTEDERRKKNAVLQQVAGGNITFTHSWFEAGITGVYTSFDNRLEPDMKPYNRFYFRGKEQFTAGMYYRMKWNKLNFFGETAYTRPDGFAALHGCMFAPVSLVQLVALFRYFSPRYDTFYANTFSESTRINNEKGFYIGAEIHPYKRWKISAYADSYRFPWLKYGVDAPSSGQDFLVQADFATQRNISMLWKIRWKEGEKNTDATSTMSTIGKTRKGSARYQLNYSFGRFSFKNILEGNMYRLQGENYTFGKMALQDIGYEFEKIPLEVDIRLQFFDASDYDNRTYTYEKDVLYAFSIPMNYGTGNRYYLLMNYKFGRNFSVWLKLAQTVYSDDRALIGSGNETINGRRKTDLRFMVRYKF